MNRMRNFFGGGSPGEFNGIGMGNSGPLGNMVNLMQMFNQFKNNPFGALVSMGKNIPQRFQNDPEAMVNYLRSSGQMNNQQFNQFSNLAYQFQQFGLM